MKKAPAWLEAFQKEWSRVLRTPLETAHGQLQAQLPDGWSRLGIVPRVQRAAQAGLEDYQRQYWFRLLTILQQDFPLTARLLGCWQFNQLALNYLVEFAPRDHDLQGIGRHFVNFLCDRHEPLFVLQAAWIDATRSAVFLAPAVQAWTAPRDPAQDPATLRLKPAADWRFVQESWPLVDLCLRLQDNPGEEAVPCPRPLAQPQTWLIQREGLGLVHRLLAAPQARLYQLLMEHAVQDALMRLEAESLSQNRALAPDLVQQWMAQSVTWRLWSA
ncbi:HvfC/BufC family peptide modification chaperone [Oligoflexus tunisiensis]|uniref:HvfC/BufC family peptide modification chaperone n=1 Tax=Oligoflexus tunisiensis TaxID=708132 RepID=UPI00114CC020|nr:putative DNA-binding domain-containing protein [Oligoflexus tunisiensis]